MIDQYFARAAELAEWVLSKSTQIVADTNSRFYWMYLLAFLVIAAAIFAVRAGRSNRSLRSLAAYIFPKDIYFHPSAAIDLQLYVANKFVSPVRVFLPYMSTAFVAAYVTSGMAHMFGDAGPILPVNFVTMALFTIGLMAALDLGEYITHRLHHQIPVLWEFHKVHRSAEVLTPMTVQRMHPMYSILDIIIRSIVSGLFQGLFAYASAGEVSAYTILGANAVLAFYYVAGSHLRHSHIWWSWGPVLSRIVISPAQHQIHHSYLPQHLDRNYGEIFALWDWAWGTLYVPKGQEELKLGIGGEQPHATLWQAYMAPFGEAARLIRRGPMAALRFERAGGNVDAAPRPETVTAPTSMTLNDQRSVA